MELSAALSSGARFLLTTLFVFCQHFVREGLATLAKPTQTQANRDNVPSIQDTFNQKTPYKRYDALHVQNISVLSKLPHSIMTRSSQRSTPNPLPPAREESKRPKSSRTVITDKANIHLVNTIALERPQVNLLQAMTYDLNNFQTGTSKKDHIEKHKLNKDLVNTFALEQNVQTGTDNKDYIWSPERIEGKGRGRIIILHGVPGVGKTYTVECIAEWSGRPLLRLSCAELGLDPVKLESQLQSYLRRAERWKAILLMDEADVYMSSRLSHNPEHTGAVSVFLRALEYYTGIIFLTTNRAILIDKAIINRALLIMEYKPLNREQINKIANNCIKWAEGTDLEFDADVADHFKCVLMGSNTTSKVPTEAPAEVSSSYDWDGREIMQGNQNLPNLIVRLVWHS
ncbi:hypothetical protein E0Z10_g3542 [Xylaria hypoxylon]|uniref:AAA+ ATPase domain-containing protein n=1 Tax=Xylaria hypoxylon TaxID=37992 RepID=A0A4Z0YN75_9PEZI|nr:hypothetical protein E0Z10_g3542 [Xylaria hypoxylon]